MPGTLSAVLITSNKITLMYIAYLSGIIYIIFSPTITPKASMNPNNIVIVNKFPFTYDEL